jgi:UDP-glucuronate 4-epimerase
MTHSRSPLRIFITGSAGFIGYHLAQSLLTEGAHVHGYDGMTEYYDVTLKRARLERLDAYPSFSFTCAMLENDSALCAAIDAFRPDVIVHLAAQAGVRYSLENPRAYLDANITGSFNILEAAKTAGVAHLLMASTSSVYGANTAMPFAETDKADTPLTVYAATKKATEAMGHSYAHIWNIPITMFRFFTVYGPWGRPDMALFKFTSAILEGRPIDIYNNGEMYRDFTYVADLVTAIRLLIDSPPSAPDSRAKPVKGDSLSPVAPFRVVNIGNSDKVRLLDFVDLIEAKIGKPAQRNYLPMQQGDVPATWANADLLRALTGYAPSTNIRDGISAFVDWYREFYKV